MIIHFFLFLDPIVILPSIYLIGLQGTPLEIIGGLVDTTVLLSRTQSAIDLHSKQFNNTQPAEQVRNLKKICLMCCKCQRNYG